MLKRALAILVLAIVAIVALRLAIGAVVGLVSLLFWLAAAVVLVGAGVWAWRALQPGARRSQVDASASTGLTARTPEDRVEIEKRRIEEQLRRQGRA